MASTLDDDRGAILRRLSDQFELCAFGLSRVRKEWERLDAGSGGGGAYPRGFVA